MCHVFCVIVEVLIWYVLADQWQVRRLQEGRPLHIPSCLVVNRWAADGDSGSHHDFRFRHDVWMILFHQIGEQITPIISIVWYFTTKSFMKTCVFTPTHATGILMADILPYACSHDTRFGRDSSWPLAPAGTHVFFRPLRVKGLFCALAGRAAFLLRRNGYAFAGTERHENGEPSLRYSVPVPFG